MSKKIYVIDACSLINASHFYFLSSPNFSFIWERIGEKFKDGSLISSREIYDEILDEDLSKWIKQYKDAFLELLPEVQNKAGIVLGKFPSMINITNRKKPSSNGDPFLIATAMYKMDNCDKDTEVIIVTDENNTKPYRIPKISKEFSIKSINLKEFLENEIL